MCTRRLGLVPMHTFESNACAGCMLFAWEWSSARNTLQTASPGGPVTKPTRPRRRTHAQHILKCSPCARELIIGSPTSPKGAQGAKIGQKTSTSARNHHMSSKNSALRPQMHTTMHKNMLGDVVAVWDVGVGCWCLGGCLHMVVVCTVGGCVISHMHDAHAYAGTAHHQRRCLDSATQNLGPIRLR